MSLFSFVELTYRMTLLKMRTYNGRVGYHNQDRSNTIRIRPLKESRYFPAVVIGADDLFTEKATQYWGDYYGVLTKTFGFCKGHQLDVTVQFGDTVLEDTGTVSATALYLLKTLTNDKLMAEYDTNGWNLGGAIRFWKRLSVHVFTREFTCVSAGLRYECTLIH